MKNKAVWSHQGDITFSPFQEEINGEKQKHNGSFIVGYGEATGHNHKVSVVNLEDMEVVKTPGGYILKLTSEGIVEHQEHKPIRLSPGIYRVGNEREKDWFQNVTRKVID